MARLSLSLLIVAISCGVSSAQYYNHGSYYNNSPSHWPNWPPPTPSDMPMSALEFERIIERQRQRAQEDTMQQWQYQQQMQQQMMYQQQMQRQMQQQMLLNEQDIVMRPVEKKIPWGPPFKGQPRTEKERQDREAFKKRFRKALDAFDASGSDVPFIFEGYRYL